MVRCGNACADEEDYFSKEDDDDEDGATGGGVRLGNGAAAGAHLPIGGGVTGGFSLSSLVDYDDDDDSSDSPILGNQPGEGWRANLSPLGCNGCL
jgi:hypothetical protein